MNTALRQRAWRRGLSAEAVGAAWLTLYGYRIVGRRLRTPVGEIDIAARRGRILAIVEVKARASHALALSAIGTRQQRRLMQATRWLIAGRPDLAALDIRFDVMGISPWRLPKHVIDAWRPDDTALDRNA